MIIIQIFSLFGEILLKDTGVENQLDKIDKKASATSNGMGKAFGAIGKASLVVGGAIVAGLGWAMAEGVKGVAAMEDQTAQLNAVLKSTKGAVGLTSKEISDMATALQLTTKFAEEDTLAGQNMLLTFTNIGKDVFPLATNTLLDLATAMGTDAKSSAIQMGKALNDPTKGITALSRVGVTFTEEQKKVIKRLQETGDMAGAQKVILAELNKEFGGSAKAAGETFSGKLVILKNSLGELTEGFATGFIPYLQKFMDFVTVNMPTIQSVMQKAFDVIGTVLKVTYNFIKDNIIPIFVKLYDWIKPYIPQIKEFVVNAFNAIRDAVMKAYDYIKPHFDQLVKVVKENLMPIIMGLWDIFKKAMPGIKSVFEIVFKILVFAIGLVLDIIGEFIKSVKGIYDFVKPGLDLLTDIFNITFGGIKKIIEGVQWVLDKFNGTPAKDKNSTVTTNYVETGRGGSGGGFGSSRGYASGTDYATPGAHWVGEYGPELLKFRGGESVLNAKDSAKIGNTIAKQPITLQLILQNGKAIAEYIIDDLDSLIGDKNIIVGRVSGI